MAVHSSPGVYTQLQDFSTYATQLTSTTLGLVGKTVKGPSEPTFISSARAFTDTYGLPRKNDYSALAAISYLEYGNALWFKRLVGSSATKANADIPTAEEKEDLILKYYDTKKADPVLTDGKQYIFEGELDNTPIPGTISVEIVKVENGEEVNPIYAYDNKLGYFNTSTYTVLTSKDNFVNYNDGSFRFTLKNQPNSNIFVKYTKKIYPIDNKSLTLDQTQTGYTKANVKSAYALSYLAVKSLNITVNDVDVLVPQLHVDSTGAYDGTIDLVSGSEYKGKLVLNGNNADIILEDDKFTGNIDLLRVTCDFVTYGTVAFNVCDIIKVKEYKDLPTTGDSSKVYLVRDTKTQYKWITSGTTGEYVEYTEDVYQKAFNGSCNTSLNKGGVFVFEGNTHLDNDLYAMLFDVNGQFEGTELNVSDQSTVNYIDYSTGKYRLVLSSLLEDRKIKISYSSKYEKELIIKNKKGNGQFSEAIVRNTISIFLTKQYTLVVPQKTDIPSVKGWYEVKGDTIVLSTDTAVDPSKNYFSLSTPNKLIGTDDGNGNILDGEEIVGSVTYYENTEGLLTSEIEVYCNVEDYSVINVLYTKSMGKVTARNYGDDPNDMMIQFYREDPNLVGAGYYGLNIWTAGSYVSQTPTENYKEFTLSDTDSTSYFLNKVTSQLVVFEFYDSVSKPIFNYYITLVNGFDDANNITNSTAIDALDEFADVETYDINLLAVPDYPGDKHIAEKLLNVCENVRGDCFCIIDPPQGLTVQNLVAWHNGTGIYANENAFNSSYGALYSDWIKINNQFSETVQWVPPSVKMVAVYAYNDANGELWYAPAGLNRGVLFNVLGCEHNLNVSDRDLIYATNNNAINPITKFAIDGVVAYGQKTLQRKSSALDRINVMRLILYVTKSLATATKYLLFEPHDTITWQKYVLIVTPFLENIKSRRGLYYYSVKCDSTTNTTSDIDNNTMVAEVILQPTKVAERIITRYKITSTGVTEVTE